MKAIALTESDRPPALSDLPLGCKFADRCPRVEAKCRAEEPALIQLGASQVRCHFPLEAP